MPFHAMSALISIPSLTYFYENMSDGYGQQLKLPKSKKFRGLNSDTLACRVPNYFHIPLSRLQISSIILKLERM